MPEHEMLRSTIRRLYFGGSEDICFANFMIFVVQDADLAIKWGEDMIEEGLIENGEENKYHFETYEVLDKELLRKQIDRAEKEN